MEDQFSPQPGFWRFLIDVGNCDEALVSEYATKHSEKWIPLGQILIEMRSITLKQVMSLLSMQAEDPALRIGDLAVREGYCTRQDIDAAIEIQRNQSPHPIELLLRDARIGDDSLFDSVGV